jgi:hypothetical protein
MLKQDEFKVLGTVIGEENIERSKVEISDDEESEEEVVSTQTGFG